MVKEASIMLRVDAQTKERIETAARATGRSVTDFLVDNALKAAAKVEAKSKQAKPKAVASGACSTWFRASCHTASAGGSGGYRWVGRQLTRALASEAPWELGIDEWGQQLDRLASMVADRATDAEIIEWFETYLPRCMQLVPPRRRALFVEGIREEVRENGIEW